MAKQLTPAGFDYGDMTEGQSSQLCHLAGYVAQEKGKIATSILEVGKHLKEAHEVLKGAGRDGSFRPWVEAECHFSKSTAYRYISAFEVFGMCPSVGHIDETAMYLLASDSTPEAAGKAAIRMAKQGKHISTAVAKELIAKATPPPDPEDDPPPEDPPETLDPDTDDGDDRGDPVDGYGEAIDDTAVGDSDGETEGPESPDNGRGPDLGGQEPSTSGSSVPVVFDARRIAAHVGQIEAALGDCALTRGGQGPGYAACMDALHQFEIEWGKWKDDDGK